MFGVCVCVCLCLCLCVYAVKVPVYVQGLAWYSSVRAVSFALPRLMLRSEDEAEALRSDLQGTRVLLQQVQGDRAELLQIRDAKAAIEQALEAQNRVRRTGRGYGLPCVRVRV